MDYASNVALIELGNVTRSNPYEPAHPNNKLQSNTGKTVSQSIPPEDQCQESCSLVHGVKGDQSVTLKKETLTFSPKSCCSL